MSDSDHEKKRDDDICPLGSDDPQALTKNDHKVIPKLLPRGTVNRPIKIVFDFSQRDPNTPMSPDEWRDEFVRHWRSLFKPAK